MTPYLYKKHSDFGTYLQLFFSDKIAKKASDYWSVT